MAVNRCFDTFNPIQNSSDYMNSTRQKTIFKDVNNNIKKFGSANPKKKNGFRYNSNFGVIENDDNTTGCLAFSTNYELFLDMTKGKTIYTNQSTHCTDANNNKLNAPIYDAWSGNLYSVNYKENDINTIATYDLSYSIINVDPSHVLFYDSCPLTDTVGYPPKWFNSVDISFNNTEYYTEANQTQILNGFNYPEKVVFDINNI
jgi:hypothetical protein